MFTGTMYIGTAGAVLCVIFFGYFVLKALLNGEFEIRETLKNLWKYHLWNKGWDDTEKMVAVIGIGLVALTIIGFVLMVMFGP